MSSENNRRIAKNTLLLYIRMLFIMGVSLYTSRVILNILGVNDYGIYNVVGGVVAMFSILSGSLSSAISRFITFELGKKDINKLKLVFSTSVFVQMILALIIIIIGEIAGVWFLNNQMKIPYDRLEAANWVLQCSIFTFAINLISIPYNAAIIAHEKMSAFAFISIIEAILKLIIVFTLNISDFDKLKTYSILLLIVSITIRLVYGIYCKRKFEECRFKFLYHRSIFKEMTSFAGWNFIGNGAYLLNTQGISILMNLFFGVTINAARGIATQADTAINQFVNNFTTAINPQITKSFANDDKEYMFQLICKGAKYSYYMMFLFAVPFILEAKIILTLWLKTVPDYSTIFLRLTILSSLCTVLSNTLVTAMFATGKIKRYQIIVGSVGSLVFPLSYIFYELGASPEVSYIIYFITYTLLLFIRLYLLRNMIGLPIMMYFKEVLFPIIPMSVCAFILPAIIYYNQTPSILRMCEIVILSIISTTSTIYFIGLDKAERNYIKSKASTIFKKLKLL